MSRTRRAMIGAGFQYAQLVLSLVTGMVLFPLTVRAVGVDAFGLWLASGEIVGYLLLGDLGVFAVLPWLIAARDGAADRPGIARLVADGLAIGVTTAGLLAAAAAGVWILDPIALGVDPVKWGLVRPALVALLGLTAAGSVLRPFTAVLTGLQDVVFGGWVLLAQSALTIGLTVGLVVIGTLGLTGLAVATALPPVIVGVAAALRVAISHRDTLRLRRPSPVGMWYMMREGFGPWVAGFGVRLLAGSTSLILAGSGRASEATLYAATGKAAQLLQNLAWILPDSGLIGLSQISAAGNPEHTRRAVLSLIVMYLLTSGFIAFAVLAANPALVRVVMGPELYAGGVVNAVLAAGLITGAAVTALFKVVAMTSYRPAIGFATLAFGGLSAALSFWLGGFGGLAWVAAGPVIAAVVFAVPVGLWLLTKAYSLSARELGGWWLTWVARSAPFLAAGAVSGVALAAHPIWCFASAVALGLGYVAFSQALVAVVPWPDAARRILERVRLVPPRPAARSS